MSPQSKDAEATGAAIAEMRRLIGDLEGRIARQVKRVENIQVSTPRAPRSTEAPAAEMQALLADMIKARDLKQAELDKLEGAQAGRPA